MKASALHTQMALHPPQQQQQQQLLLFHMVGMGWCGAGNQLPALIQQQMLPPTVFSEPESVLTCNLSGARKRAREDGPPVMLPSTNASHQQFLLQKHLLDDILPAQTIPPNHSAVTSTSCRPPLSAAQPSSTATPANNNDIDIAPGSSSSSSSGLNSMLRNHSLEIDALVRVHAHKLWSSLDDARKRQCCAAVAALDHQAQRSIAEKQAELEAAATRNAELQERLRQAAVESQAWFNVARNSEALVAALRASIEHALLQKLGACNNNNGDGCCAAGVHLPGAAAEQIEEGYGDSEEEAAPRCTEASSSSVVGATRNKPSASTGCSLRCKSCGDHDARVLLLPCRHLCLCPSCEPALSECPVCGRRKNATLNINLS